MSKQRPTSDRIANELAGASAFFRNSTTPPIEPPPAAAPAAPVVTPVPQPHPASPVAPVTTPGVATRTPRTLVLPARRQMIRHPFELYMDQLDSLRELAESQRRRGEPASMSRMVREAIDRYLADNPRED